MELQLQSDQHHGTVPSQSQDKIVMVELVDPHFVEKLTAAKENFVVLSTPPDVRKSKV
jgi:hypothetical protein